MFSFKRPKAADSLLCIHFRQHWCKEAVTILEEMHSELCDSGDEIEWHVRDVLAVAYFQLCVVQYEEKVLQSTLDVNESINYDVNICQKEHPNGNNKQIGEGVSKTTVLDYMFSTIFKTFLH